MSWLPVSRDSDFPIQNLPYGVFGRPGELHRVGVAIGDQVLDVAALAMAGALEYPECFVARSLNTFLAAGRSVWQQTRQRLVQLLDDGGARPSVEPYLVPMADVLLHMPFEIGDYVDFYSSIEHATNVGQILRPDGEPLPPNWRHLPIGYHGRAGSVVVSGTPIVRPTGQRKIGKASLPTHGQSQRLDIEAEVGFVVGTPTSLGSPVAAADYADHVFGVVLVNDWSARDLQVWEGQPLGPFLSKSFATSVSPWVVPLEALEYARVDGPAQDPSPLPYLRRGERAGLDIALKVSLNGTVISRPPFAGMYWTADQQLAHLTVNGAPLRTGDLFASGTVSGPQVDQRGSLIELTWDGDQPLALPDGVIRTYLEDGDVVSIRGSAPGVNGTTIGFGEVTGQILPARGSR
ncbi:MAG: fumarylacetoacetase [Pseudonocardiales bacterium]|nr:MAG: fumarylacetoacetase [Pseudonocardiales bacterium]